MKVVVKLQAEDYQLTHTFDSLASAWEFISERLTAERPGVPFVFNHSGLGWDIAEGKLSIEEGLARNRHYFEEIDRLGPNHPYAVELASHGLDGWSEQVSYIGTQAGAWVDCSIGISFKG